MRFKLHNPLTRGSFAVDPFARDPFALSACILCHQTSKSLICQDCLLLMPNISRCFTCGYPSQHTHCNRCSHKKIAIDQTIVAVDYMPPFDRLIQNFKYNHDLAAGKALSMVLASKIPNTLTPDILIPIPLYITKEQNRGYNQALLIAQTIQQLSHPAFKSAALCNNILIRNKPTDTQTMLSLRQRFKNVHNAFSVQQASSLKNLHIALIDDVFTTGATLLSAAKLLKKAGVATISALVLARHNLKG